MMYTCPSHVDDPRESRGDCPKCDITGESAPVPNGVREPVIGATLAGIGALLMRADRVAADTLLERIAALVAEAQRSRAAVPRLADQVTAAFVPGVLAVSVLTFATWSLIGPEPAMAHGMVNPVAVLIIACPCVLRLATPISNMVGTGRAAHAPAGHGLIRTIPKVSLAVRRTLLMATVLVGCASEPPGRRDTATSEDVCTEDPSILSLGESMGTSMLQDGSIVTLVHGPQGGWHVGLDATVRASREVRVTPALFRSTTGEQLAGTDNTWDLVLWDWDAASCRGTLTGLLAYIDDPEGVDQDWICALAGERIDATLTLEDLIAGGSATSTVSLVTAPDPDDPCRP